MSGPSGRWPLARQVASVLRLRPFETETEGGRSRERYRRAALTFLATVAGRGAATLATLVAVPVMLSYLGAERYGAWAALSSAAAALLFADLGIGNGLLSVLAHDSGRAPGESARRHVSSAFFALTALAAALGLAFALAYPRLDWARLFRAASPELRAEVGPMVLAFVACFLVGLPLGLAARIRLARQEGFSNGAWSAAGSVLGVALMFGAIGRGLGLPGVVLALSAGPPLALLAQSVVLFAVQERGLRPRLGEASTAAAARILRLGFAFSLLQLAAAVAYASDAFLAGALLSPSAAARYGVVATLFDLPLTLLAMMLMPLWPAYGEALGRQDTAWMRQTLRRSLQLALAFGVGVGALLLLAGPVLVKLWVGEAMVPSRGFLALMALRLLLLSLGHAVAIFLNGAGLIRVQLLFGSAMALAAVALKVMLAPRWGLHGIVAGTLAAQVLFGLLPYAFTLRSWLRRPGPGA